MSGCILTMKLIPLSQGYFTQVDDSDFNHLIKLKWWISKSDTRIYATGVVSGGRKISLHRYLMGATDPKIDIDHRDGNTLNNQRDNLRIATRTQNNANAKTPKDNRSGYKGVSFDKARGLWSASAGRVNIGRFDCKHEAARHYNKTAKELWGEYARLNVVDPMFPTTGKSPVNRNNTSGFAGVHLDGVGKWRSEIIRNGVKRRLGPFTNKEDAVKAKESAEAEFLQNGFLEIMTIDSAQSWRGNTPCCFYRFDGQKRLKRISNQLAAELYKSGKFDMTDMAKKWFIENGLLPSD